MPTEIYTGQTNPAQNQGVRRSNALENRNNAKVSDEQGDVKATTDTAKVDSNTAQNAGENSVVISESGQKLQALEQSIRQEPQVRVELVREIQKRIEDGDFPIDVQDLARQILDQESQL